MLNTKGKVDRMTREYHVIDRQVDEPLSAFNTDEVLTAAEVQVRYPDLWPTVSRPDFWRLQLADDDCHEVTISVKV